MEPLIDRRYAEITPILIQRNQDAKSQLAYYKQLISAYLPTFSTSTLVYFLPKIPLLDQIRDNIGKILATNLQPKHGNSNSHKRSKSGDKKPQVTIESPSESSSHESSESINKKRKRRLERVPTIPYPIDTANLVGYPMPRRRIRLIQKISDWAVQTSNQTVPEGLAQDVEDELAHELMKSAVEAKSAIATPFSAACEFHRDIPRIDYYLDSKPKSIVHEVRELDVVPFRSECTLLVLA
jgi:hypothetical protein